MHDPETQSEISTLIERKLFAPVKDIELENNNTSIKGKGIQTMIKMSKKLKLKTEKKERPKIIKTKFEEIFIKQINDLKDDMNKKFDNLLNLFNLYLESRKDDEKEINIDLRPNLSTVKSQKVKKERKEKNCPICMNDFSSSIESIKKGNKKSRRKKINDIKNTNFLYFSPKNEKIKKTANNKVNYFLGKKTKNNFDLNFMTL